LIIDIAFLISIRYSPLKEKPLRVYTPNPSPHTGEACPELVEGGFEKYLTNPPNRYITTHTNGLIMEHNAPFIKVINPPLE
jgi:hypothetical protein